MKKRNYGLKWISSLIAVACAACMHVQAALYPDMPASEPTGVDLSWMAPFDPPIDANMAVSPDAPQIAEWTRQNDPGDTMVLTGEALSSHTGIAEGRDTRFVLYGENPKNNVYDGLIQRLDGRQCAITLSTNLPPKEMYLMWPHNDSGYGEPIAINRTEAWWIGFDKISRGDEFFVYGRSLQLGDGECHLFYTNETSGIGGWLTSMGANPYRAPFVMPKSVPTGTYTIWTHNGHGGKYGWSSSLELDVIEAYARIDHIYNVEDYGANGSDLDVDSVAIEAARHDAAVDQGSTLYFPAGTYYLTEPLKLSKNTTYAGDGMDSTILTMHSSAADNPSLAIPSVFNGSVSNVVIKDLTFLANEYSVLSSQYVQFGYMHDCLYENIRIARDSIYESGPQGPFAAHNGVRLTFRGCEFFSQNGAYISNLKDGRFEDCKFIGRGDCNQYTAVLGAHRLDFDGCLVKNDDDSDSSSGDGWGKGRWITMTSTMTDLYVGNSVVTNSGPRRPTPYIGPCNITTVTAYTNEAFIPNFGVFGEQSLQCDFDIPMKYHDMTPPTIQWGGDKATVTYEVSGAVRSRGPYVKTIDAVNDIITVLMPEGSTPIPQAFDRMTLSIADIVDENSGEIILYEGVASALSDSPKSATANSLVFADTDAMNAASGSETISIVDGRGLGQTRRVESIDVDTGTVVVKTPFKVIPDSTSVVNFGSFAYHTLLYNNVFDGRLEGTTNYSAVTALNIYGNGSGIVVADNYMHELRACVSFFAEGYSGYTPRTSVRSAEMFNFVSGNLIDSCSAGFALNERENTANPSNNDGVRHLGHVFRGNTNLNAYGSIVSMSSKSTSAKAPYGLNVFQGNVFSNFVGSIDEDAGVENQVWVGNTFYGKPDQIGYTIADNHNPVLRGNRWLNFDSKYGGNHPGAKLEMPKRHAELCSDIRQVKIPVWNSGTDSMKKWSVKKLTDAPWLGVSSSSTPVINETGIGLVTLNLLEPLPTEDSEAILSISDGGDEQQVTIIYTVQNNQIAVSKTTYTLPAGTFWVEVVDQDTQAMRDLGLWHGPCPVPIEDMPEAGTVVVKKKNEKTGEWERYQEIGKGNRSDF